MKNLVFKHNTVLTNTSNDSKTDLKSNPVNLKFMNIEKYCTYSKRLRVTAYVLKFINNLKGQSKKSNNNLSTFITKQKHDLTGYLWLTYIEKDVFTGK